MAASDFESTKSYLESLNSLITDTKYELRLTLSQMYKIYFPQLTKKEREDKALNAVESVNWFENVNQDLQMTNKAAQKETEDLQKLLLLNKLRVRVKAEVSQLLSYFQHLEFKNSITTLKNAISDLTHTPEIFVDSPNFPATRQWRLHANFRMRKIEIDYQEKYVDQEKNIVFQDLLKYSIGGNKELIVNVDEIYLTLPAQALRADLNPAARQKILQSLDKQIELQEKLGRSDLGIGKKVHPAASDAIWLAVELGIHCATHIFKTKLFKVKITNAREGHKDETLEEVYKFYTKVMEKVKNSFVDWEAIEIKEVDRKFTSTWKKAEGKVTHKIVFMPRFETWLKL